MTKTLITSLFALGLLWLLAFITHYFDLQMFGEWYSLAYFVTCIAIMTMALRYVVDTF